VEQGEHKGGRKGGLLQLERHGRIKPTRGVATGRWSMARRGRGRQPVVIDAVALAHGTW
jgi:hypothetical protein